ncbi:MAG: hypothetical protein AAF696_35370 [Bacteroidota bacterium]
MSKHLLHFFLAAFFTYSLIACDRPACENTHAIFDEHGPETSIYQEALIDIMEGQDLRYWLKAYEEKAGKAYLWLHVQNEEICALAKMKVGEKEGIEGLLAAKGVRYRGAELVGLVYQVSPQKELVFEQVDYILD